MKWNTRDAKMFNLFLLALIANIMAHGALINSNNDKGIGKESDIEVNGYIMVSKESKQNGEGKLKKITPPCSCLDHLKNGETGAKVFRIMTPNGPQQVLCDLRSEPGSAWTLVLSHRMEYRNKNSIAPFKKPLNMNLPVNEKTPNLNIYRMTLAQMEHLKNQSTHWRVTCSGSWVDYRDYLRARFADFDPVKFIGDGVCKKVEYINIRGHVGIEVTALFYQIANEEILHHDSSVRSRCQFSASPGHVFSEDNFGFYARINKSFRCSKRDYSTSNMWFGSYL